MDEDRLTNIERAISDFRAAVEERFDAVERRFDGVDQRFDAVDRRLDAVDQRFEAADRRFETVATKVDMDRRFDEMEAQLKVMIESVGGDVRMVAEAHVALEKRVTALERQSR